MFKFGFSSDACEGTSDEDRCEKKWDDCMELVPSENKILEDVVANAEFNIITLGDVHIKYVSSNNVLEILRNMEHSDKVSVLKAEQNHSDLLPAIYEGGFKIWECTYDLLNYVYDNKITFENKKVLDLGCGAGVIGIYTILKGSSCYFQDYNSDVIEYITASNVLLNSRDCITKCKFYSGDWLSFSNLLEGCTKGDNKFDYIFTSETIYNTENYYKLHTVFEKLLKKSGTIFLAAKSFYFGVGGGTSLFEEYIENNKIFKYSCIWKCAEGVKREILKIQFNDP
ncbi:histidine protein methyltransferase 1 homolog isoform X2 [Anoplophora glabripennis]|uniref:histidine protein methyltransferase 1 homolog isoform X2 n=1 Tax=Anoplophora glabripennis TaxID=217634 RepID=UPI000873863B|nr:histidine protein methyltransferase 1 homolog isoform X2 [Anoplophora glabripennis]